MANDIRKEIKKAFLEVLDQKISGTRNSQEIMKHLKPPGSKELINEAYAIAAQRLREKGTFISLIDPGNGAEDITTRIDLDFLNIRPFFMTVFFWYNGDMDIKSNVG